VVLCTQPHPLTCATPPPPPPPPLHGLVLSPASERAVKTNVCGVTCVHTATHYNILQHAATRCSQDKCVWCDMCTHCNTLQHTATRCNTLQHTAVKTNVCGVTYVHTATHCNTLQHTATHCNTTATHCSQDKCVWRDICAHCNTLQHTATHCNTLQSR